MSTRYCVPSFYKKYPTCAVPCDYIPRRSWPLFRAKVILEELIAELQAAARLKATGEFQDDFTIVLLEGAP